ncbi:hypothetical protein [Actinomadura violacea]|uniref:Phage head morphogenesis domain-containing protein n=1 Tax=Actinomadura violacea TaxID=2819934 RepID=A0ABS3RST6_9ACTN|nr:hypothetical protein [Actinomadura violacea]MBO2459817.1 hypothetical protein [Actinomadura violacea]
MNDQQPTRRDQRVVETIAAVLSAGLSAAAATATLRKALAPLRLAGAAVRAAIDLGRRLPAIASHRTLRSRLRAGSQRRSDAMRAGPAGSARLTAYWYRARYLVNAARRFHAAVKARARRESEADAIRKAMRAERRYLSQHLAAQRNRVAARREVERMVAIHGDRLGWFAVRDGATTSDCSHAHGRDFLVSWPPSIGFPGAVHPRCRCRPVAPWGAPLLS